jgi:hypothetical protein
MFHREAVEQKIAGRAALLPLQNDGFSFYDSHSFNRGIGPQAQHWR